MLATFDHKQSKSYSPFLGSYREHSLGKCIDLLWKATQCQQKNRTKSDNETSGNHWQCYFKVTNVTGGNKLQIMALTFSRAGHLNYSIDCHLKYAGLNVFWNCHQCEQLEVQKLIGQLATSARFLLNLLLVDTHSVRTTLYSNKTSSNVEGTC